MHEKLNDSILFLPVNSFIFSSLINSGFENILPNGTSFSGYLEMESTNKEWKTEICNYNLASKPMATESAFLCKTMILKQSFIIIQSLAFSI